jgi:hypothetical protein
MNPRLIIAIVASLCVGGAAGAGVSHYLVERPACAKHHLAEIHQRPAAPY